MNQTNVTEIMATVEHYPTPVQETQIENRTKYPVCSLGSLGIISQYVSSFVENVFHIQGKSGFYHVQVPPLQHLGSRKAGGFFGATLWDMGGSKFAGQPNMTSIPCDPMTLFMSAALISIEKKLDVIQETQQEIIDFLEQKEKAVLKGNLNVLNDVLCNYKYNCDNEKYKNNKHLQAQEIKRDAEQSIVFYREQIKKRVSKQNFLHSDRDVIKMLDKVQENFCDYELALYLYAFSSFLEVMLLENFAEDYLNNISSKIKEYALQYEELHNTCFDLIEKYAKTSINSHTLGFLSKAGKRVGGVVAKIPLIGKSKIDEGLIEAGGKLEEKNEERTQRTLGLFAHGQTDLIQPFIESLEKVNRLHNSTLDIIVDEEYLYVA